MAQQVTNTYLEGMNKDIDRGLISNKAYLEANNFRIITTKGSTSGSLENVRGNKVLSTGTIIDSDQEIIGGIEIRDEVVLFTTSNTGTSPSGGRSCIWKLTLDLDTETQTALTLLYDDNLNAGTTSSDFLNFSTAYPVKCVARYETSDIKKVYWTDGYNTLRYVDIGKNLTISGDAYNLNDYMSTDKFSLQPNFAYTKPEISNVISGSLTPGMVQYTYQLYRLNGSETSYAPLSNTMHVTGSDDLASSDYFYKGSSDITDNTGKGFRVHIPDNSNKGFDRARLIRLHYTSLNSTPSVNIVSESIIPTDGSEFYINDVGDSLATITVESLNITNTELFTAQDIETKNDILFAGNIESEIFDIGDYDSRAVRFVSYTEAGTPGQTDTTLKSTSTSSLNVSAVWVNNNTVDMTITNFPTWLSVSPRTVTDFIDVVVSSIYVEYEVLGSFYNNIITSGITVSLENLIGTTATFRVATSSTLFTAGVPTSVDLVNLSSPTYTYEYTGTGATVEYAKVQDSNLGTVTITEPVDNTSLSSWNSAGWSDYDIKHDGINEYNNPDNNYDDEKEYQYQSDCSTLGAEGPNVTIGFTVDTLYLDDATSNQLYAALQEGTTVNPSFTNYASPWMAGERCFQRDEVYRLSVVFHDEEGRSSFPQWICDLKIPSMKKSGYGISYASGSDTIARQVYPNVTFRNFPTGAVSAQIHMVPRDTQDRSVYTQGMVVPTTTTVPREPALMTANVLTSNGIVKLVTPEIMINGDIDTSSGDYLEYLGAFTTVLETTSYTDATLTACRTYTAVTADPDNDTDVDVTLKVTPTDTTVTYNIGGIEYENYNDTTYDSYGCSGVVIKYDKAATWDAIGNDYCLVNYRKNVFESQYGGNTYENRSTNYYRPCSDIIESTGVNYDIKNGDTFVSLFEVSNFLFDLTKTTGNSEHETIWFPVESSINLALRHDQPVTKGLLYGSSLNWVLIQEVAGEHVDGSSRTYTQYTDLYQYNSVYSQQQTVGYKYARPADWVEVTEFDTRIKNSQPKINGEISDSWTNFLTNDFIEVDSTYGSVNAIHTFNNSLYYFQDNGVGIVAVKPRSLVQDNTGASLVLGDGGVLDRYDYISQEVGGQDKFGIVKSKTSLYWFDRLNKSIYTISDGIRNLSRAKYVQSFIETEYESDHNVLLAFDKKNDEILITMWNGTLSESYTLAFNELLDAFTGFYDNIPEIYIPYKNKLLTTTSGTYSDGDVDRDYIFVHDSDLVDRCWFWALSSPDATKYVDSNIEMVFNPDYNNIKVFDNFTFVSNAWSSDDTIYNETFDTVQCYNDYQNTTAITLTYNDNLRRRERRWSTYVPRNAVDVNVASNPDIETDVDTSRRFKERMRGNYMIANFVYNNGSTYDKFVASDITLHYRKSFR